jgi:hypothetical protein
MLPAAAPAAGGYGFSGFSNDGTRFLKHGPDDRACTVALPPVCQPIDRKASGEFVKPPRTRKLDGVPIDAAIEDGAVVVRAGQRLVGRFQPEAPAISANANVFVAPSGAAIAVEYIAKRIGADVVVFALDPAPSPPAVVEPRASPPAAGGNAYDRAVAKGGVWEQRMMPCDQAGVRLTLKKDRSFALRIDTKCEGRKDTTELAGKWSSEGANALSLAFENAGGPTELVPCRFAVCGSDDGGAGEDCLGCESDDVSFTLHVVRR